MPALWWGIAGATALLLGVLVFLAWRELLRSDEELVRALAEEMAAARVEGDWEGFVDLLDPALIRRFEEDLIRWRKDLPRVPGDLETAGVTEGMLREGSARDVCARWLEGALRDQGPPARVEHVSVRRSGDLFVAEVRYEGASWDTLDFKRSGWRGLGRWRCIECQLGCWVSTMKFIRLERKLPAFLPVGSLVPADVLAVLTVGPGGLSGEEQDQVAARLNVLRERGTEPAVAVLDASPELSFGAVVGIHDFLLRQGIDEVWFAAPGEPPADGLWLNGESVAGPDEPPPHLLPERVLGRVIRVGRPR